MLKLSKTRGFFVCFKTKPPRRSIRYYELLEIILRRKVMSSFVGFMNNILYQPFIVPLFLIAVGIYFTIRTKGVQVRMFTEMFKVVTEKPADEKGISSFGALMVSTASVSISASLKSRK